MAINILLNMAVSCGETASALARRQTILLRSCAALRLLVAAVGDQDFIEHDFQPGFCHENHETTRTICSCLWDRSVCHFLCSFVDFVAKSS
ncbi:hypothetical protein [Chromobacterium amazonense]|uniref:hypothetical protein n=1 Tax=Chromobacterium amazonense TaxID=1382803 RepID=UPI003F793609